MSMSNPVTAGGMSQADTAQSLLCEHELTRAWEDSQDGATMEASSEVGSQSRGVPRSASLGFPGRGGGACGQ